MRFVRDMAYLIGAIVTSPVWLIRLVRTGKIRTDWPARFGRGTDRPKNERPCVLIHAVSVGEINAIGLLVERLGEADDAPAVVVATTTDTGSARARALFGETHVVVRYPFDFSWSVARFLDRVRPDVVVLTELEVWPNFVAMCHRRAIPVCVVNGRLTARSAARYAWVRGLVRPAFAKLAFAAVQTEDYAQRFQQLGVAPERVRVTGTMKWDTARIADDVPGATALATAMGIDTARPLVVAGSTAPEEHALLRDAVPDDVQLLCAPRRPEWFDDAASVLEGCARRSRGDRGSATGRFLLDTIGELRAAYALADLVVIGRSFGERHGSDLMEPVALGKAVIVGPRMDDFAESVVALLAGDGVVQVPPSQLATTIGGLLSDPVRRNTLAQHGRAVILAQQGATERHAEMITALLAKGSSTRA